VDFLITCVIYVFRRICYEGYSVKPFVAAFVIAKTLFHPDGFAFKILVSALWVFLLILYFQILEEERKQILKLRSVNLVVIKKFSSHDVGIF
jgi:hypothetical protein